MKWEIFVDDCGNSKLLLPFILAWVFGRGGRFVYTITKSLLLGNLNSLLLDETVIGTPFYLMEFVDGKIYKVGYIYSR